MKLLTITAIASGIAIMAACTTTTTNDPPGYASLVQSEVAVRNNHTQRLQAAAEEMSEVLSRVKARQARNIPPSEWTESDFADSRRLLELREKISELQNEGIAMDATLQERERIFFERNREISALESVNSTLQNINYSLNR